jgi:hypothetical protein
MASAYLENPGLLVGMLWAFLLIVATGASILCIPLSFFSKSCKYAYRISRAILWGTVPLVVLYFLASVFDPPDWSGDRLLGPAISCVPAPLALVAFLISRRTNRKIRLPSGTLS